MPTKRRHPRRGRAAGPAHGLDALAARPPGAAAEEHRLPVPLARARRRASCRPARATSASSAGPRSARPPEPRTHMNARMTPRPHPTTNIGYQTFTARQLHLPPRRVLRAHRLDHARRQADEPHDGRRQLPARADARRRLGLLLRLGQLRPRDRHRQPLRVGRPVRRRLQRHDEGSGRRPAGELPHRRDPRHLRGDARRLDQRRLRPVRRAAGDRHGVRPQERQQHREDHPGARARQALRRPEGRPRAAHRRARRAGQPRLRRRAAGRSPSCIRSPASRTRCMPSTCSAF